MYRKVLVSHILPALVLMVVVASLFVYYPLTIRAVPQEPGVIFVAGSNTNTSDIGSTTITVIIGRNGTSAEVEIHPTYQKTYYKDVLRIANNDNEEMNVYIIFTSLNNNLPTGSRVVLFVYEGTTKVKELNITSPPINMPLLIGELAAGDTWELDIYVYIPEGTSITGRSYTASAEVVYTPSDERPPVNPSSGR